MQNLSKGVTSTQTHDFEQLLHLIQLFLLTQQQQPILGHDFRQAAGNDGFFFTINRDEQAAFRKADVAAERLTIRCSAGTLGSVRVIIEQMNHLPGWPYFESIWGTVAEPEFVVHLGDFVDGGLPGGQRKPLANDYCKRASQF